MDNYWQLLDSMFWRIRSKLQTLKEKSEAPRKTVNVKEEVEVLVRMAKIMKKLKELLKESEEVEKKKQSSKLEMEVEEEEDIELTAEDEEGKAPPKPSPRSPVSGRAKDAIGAVRSLKTVTFESVSKAMKSAKSFAEVERVAIQSIRAEDEEEEQQKRTHGGTPTGPESPKKNVETPKGRPASPAVKLESPRGNAPRNHVEPSTGRRASIAGETPNKDKVISQPSKFSSEPDGSASPRREKRSQSLVQYVEGKVFPSKGSGIGNQQLKVNDKAKGKNPSFY